LTSFAVEKRLAGMTTFGNDEAWEWRCAGMMALRMGDAAWRGQVPQPCSRRREMRDAADLKSLRRALAK
jgi:hypothetical protein